MLLKFFYYTNIYLPSCPSNKNSIFLFVVIIFNWNLTFKRILKWGVGKVVVCMGCVVVGCWVGISFPPPNFFLGGFLLQKILINIGILKIRLYYFLCLKVNFKSIVALIYDSILMAGGEVLISFNNYIKVTLCYCAPNIIYI